MQIHAEQTFNGYEPFSMPGPNPCVVVDRSENGVAVIDLTGPLVVGGPVHALHDRILVLLDLGTKDFAINLADVPYADSYGLGGLAAAYNLIQNARGSIKL